MLFLYSRSSNLDLKNKQKTNPELVLHHLFRYILGERKKKAF